MNKKYKILTFILIHFCFLNDALAEVKIENVTSVVVDNRIPAITDFNQDKTIMDSKIDASLSGYFVERKKIQNNLNNFAIGVSFGKKFEFNKLKYFTQNFNKYFVNKFILTEFFFNKNILARKKYSKWRLVL